MGTLQDKQIIFVISQPRSGSTLLQHIIGSHSQVHTVPEPWFMLNLVYGIRRTGWEAEYNSRIAYIALEEFLGRLPNGEQTYLEGIRRMAAYIYDQALLSTRKRYFLDKTPRYYLIIPELRHIFPEAKFVFLIRNPLAVFSSIIEVNFGGNWRGLFLPDRKLDILSAPLLILQGIERLGRQATVVHYESLVREPQETIRTLCRELELRFESDMLHYGNKVQFADSALVDPKSIYRHRGPVEDYVDQWLTRLDTSQKVYFAKEYLAELGSETVDELGYSYDLLMNKLNSLAGHKHVPLVPWRLLVRRWDELHWWNRLRVLAISSLEARGWMGTLRAIVRRLS